MAWAPLKDQESKPALERTFSYGRLEMKTRLITCVQCEKEFEFSIIDQKNFRERGFDPPKRCPSCRRKKSKLSELQQENKHNNKKKYHRQDYEN